MELVQTLLQNDTQAAQALIRAIIAEQPNPWQQPELREYCRMRWTSRFLTAAEQDEKALHAAGRRRVKKSPREALLRRFLVGHDFDVPLYDAPLEPINSDVTFLFVPGMLNGMLPVRAFVPAMETVTAQTGIRFLRADVHPLATPDANSADIARAIEEGAGLDPGGNVVPKEEQQPVKGKVILMGYSKGMPDITAFLVNYPVLAKRVVAVVSWAGANGGAYAANDIPTDLLSLADVSDHERLQSLLQLMGHIPLSGGYRPFRRSDEAKPGACFAALKTDTRDAFWNKHSTTLDDLGIPFFAFAGEESPLSVPWFQLKDSLSLLIHSVQNDMQLTRAQADLPLSNRVEMPLLHGHHWDLSYPSFPIIWKGGSRKLDHPFPKVAALGAHVGLLADLGLW